MGRPARVRRHRHADAAAHRAALRRALGARGARDAHSAARHARRSKSSRTTGRARSAARRAGRSATPTARRSATPTPSGSRPSTTGSSAARQRRAVVKRRRSRPRRPLPPAAPSALPRRQRPQRLRSDAGCGTGRGRLQRAAGCTQRRCTAPRGDAGTRDRLPARSQRLGRPLRQQRLAAGSAEAADEADVGHRRVGQPEARAGQRASTTATSSSCATAAPPRACRSSSCPGSPISRSPCSSATAAAWPAASARRPRKPRRSTPIGCARRTRPWFGTGLEIVKTGDRYLLATTQDHHAMEGRHPARVVTLAEYTHEPEVVAAHAAHVSEDADALPGPRVHGQQVGHGDRPDVLHRLRRLRRRLRRREQHPGRRQGAGQRQPRDALDPRRPLLHGRHRARRSRCRPSTSRCRVSSARTRRARWSARSPRRRTARKA